MKFDLQMFKGNVSSTTTYQMSPEEKALLNQELKVAEAYFPNITRLNDIAGNLLYDSYGTVQADYGAMNDKTQNIINQNQQAIGDLQNGILNPNYQAAMENSIRSGVQNTLGSSINDLANRGVINSSMGSKAMNDISRNASDSMAQQYANNISMGSQLAQQGIDNATANTVASSANSEAAQSPALNLWNASLGLNTAGNTTLGAVAGKIGTKTTTQSGGQNTFSSIMSPIAQLGGSYLMGLGSRTS